MRTAWSGNRVIWAAARWAALLSCLLLPMAAVGVLVGGRLTGVDLVIVLGFELVGFGAMAWFGFHRGPSTGARRRVLLSLSVAGAAISLVVAVAAMAWQLSGHGRGDAHVALAVLAGGSAAILHAIYFLLVLPAAADLYVLHVHGWRFRRCGLMPPVYLIAALLLFDLVLLQEERGTWRQAPTRRRLLRSLTWTTFLIERWVPQVLWYARVAETPRVHAKRFCADLGVMLRSMQWDLANAADAAGYDAVQQRLARTAVAVVRGDLSAIPGSVPVGRRQWLTTLLHRIPSVAALLAAAAALPYVPGVAGAGSAVTTARVGLVIAAVLVLASVDSSSQSRIVDVLGGTPRGGP
ncbi:hypothetical protein ACFQX7_26420 [Luedemannella flava]